MKKYKFYFSLIMLLFVFSCDRYKFLTEGEWEDKFGSGGGGGGDKTVYVSLSGGSGTAGVGLTPSNPVKNIDEAIQIADNNNRTEIHVEGQNIYNYPNTITLRSGISLYGGYSSDFKTRDINNNFTIIYIGTNPGFSVNNINSVKIDGFTIVASNGGSTFYCYSSSNIMFRNNIIRCAGGNQTFNSGFLIRQSNVGFINNVIIPETGSGTQDTMGIIIEAIGGQSNVIARNNTIDNGNASNKYCLHLTQNSTVYPINLTLQNNIMVSNYKTANSYGIYIANLMPLMIREYNLYLNLSNGVYSDNDDMNLNMSIHIPQNLFAAYSSQNYELKNYLDIESIFGAANSSLIVWGAIDGYSQGWGYNYDRNGAIRSPGWTRGAYEQDN